jgi:hypothetical protein
MRRLIVGLLFVLILAGPLPAWAAVAWNATTSALQNVGTNTVTFSHTVAGGTPAIVVYVPMLGTAQTVSSITYAGQSLALGCAQNITGTTGRVEAWRLLAPPAGTANVVVTLSGVNAAWDAVATSVSGAESFGACFEADGGATNVMSQTVTAGASGDLVIHGSISTADNIATVTATSRWSDNNGSTNTQGGTTSGGASVQVTHTWDNSSAGKGLIAFNISAAPPDVIPPTDPTNLACSGLTSTSMSCTWAASTDANPVTYRLEQSSGSACSGFSEIQQPSTASATITGLPSLTTRCIRVRASDGTNFSGYTTAVQAATLGVRSATIAWNGTAVTTEDSFEIWRCEGGSCSDHVLVDTVAANVSQYTDATSPLPAGCYKVKAALSGTVGSSFTNSWCSPQTPSTHGNRVRGWRR